MHRPEFAFSFSDKIGDQNWICARIQSSIVSVIHVFGVGTPFQITDKWVSSF